MKYDVIVIGGAFAGLTAAIYSARQGMKTLVLTKDIGGQGLLTNDIQNFPGFTSISGFDLANKFQEQASLYGTEFVYDEVTGIEDREGQFLVKTREESYEADSVVLAFGKTPRDLNVPGEEKYKGRGVSYCSICDGPLYRNKEVMVAGAGDHALQAALYLATVASKVYVPQKGNRISGSEDMINDAKALENVEFIYESEVSEIKGEKTVSSVILKNKSGNTTEVPVRAVFVEMGYVAKTSMLKGFVDMNKDGEVLIDMNGATSHPGVFAAGDVTNIPYKQAIISAGQGSVAALSAINYIHRKRGKGAMKSDWKYIPTGKKEEKLRI
ncbi:NAD(P)/FAD-dependent oxidoreductase [Cuniculiplasma sp. SKW3]|uniref:NAD(P)/FAD-dependent oxidoreductase n=1 Tax=unclassified Cuniculiplasma TaxID=2619706 RepID=UPI003FD623F2